MLQSRKHTTCDLVSQFSCSNCVHKHRNRGLWYKEGEEPYAEEKLISSCFNNRERLSIWSKNKSEWHLKKTQTRDNHRGEIPRWPNLAFIEKPKDKQLFGLLSCRAITHLLSGVAIFSLSDKLQAQHKCDLNFTNDRVSGIGLANLKTNSAHANFTLVSGRA